MNDSFWTPAAIVELRRLWELGTSTKGIGEAMGITKNAVVGKAHRLDLPGRPSPINGGPDILSDEVRERIADLLKRGHGVAEIARERGIGHEASIRVIRDGLGIAPMRWRPGHSDEPARTLPRLQSLDATSDLIVVKEKPAPKPRIIRAPLQEIVVDDAIVKYTYRGRQCCWPIGDTKARDFRYCDEATGGHPTYCVEHQYVSKHGTPTQKVNQNA